MSDQDKRQAALKLSNRFLWCNITCLLCVQALERVWKANLYEIMLFLTVKPEGPQLPFDIAIHLKSVLGAGWLAASVYCLWRCVSLQRQASGKVKAPRKYLRRAKP